MAGPTTQLTRLTTGEYVSFAPEALQGALEQVREASIPLLIEHLSFLPPLGLLSDGEIRKLGNDAQQLFLFGNEVDRVVVDLQTDPFMPDRRILRQAAATIDHSEVLVEPRNFSPSTFSEAQSECPVGLREQSKWASLPPLEWLITIGVTWSAVKFTGSFLEHLGDAAGEATVNWIKRFARRVKQAKRDQFVTLAFATPEGSRVLGFIPFEVTAASTDPALEDAVDTAGFLAEIAGTVQPQTASTVAYLYTDGEWHLAWWLDAGGVCISTTFADKCPDPKRFL